MPLPNSSSSLRIRQTIESDLPIVSDFLSTAAVHSTGNNNPNANYWQSKMDQLWARYDYESLLKRRWRAIQEGRKAVARLDDWFWLQQQQQQDNDNSSYYLEHLWWSSDRLRSEIAAAARETGEDTVWRRRGVDLPPESRHWLNHIQLTATQQQNNNNNNNKVVVVGFVEVAMLVNPCIRTHTAAGEGEVEEHEPLLHHPDESCRIAVSTNDNHKEYHYYSPAITNLAVAPHARRQGVGHRLLASAEAYVARNWNATTLGLYVQEDNVAARTLYDTRGYQAQLSLHDERLGRLWYCSKVLNKSRSRSSSMQHRRKVPATQELMSSRLS